MCKNKEFYCEIRCGVTDQLIDSGCYTVEELNEFEIEGYSLSFLNNKEQSYYNEIIYNTIYA